MPSTVKRRSIQRGLEATTTHHTSVAVDNGNTAVVGNSAPARQPPTTQSAVQYEGGETISLGSSRGAVKL